MIFVLLFHSVSAAESSTMQGIHLSSTLHNKADSIEAASVDLSERIKALKQKIKQTRQHASSVSKSPANISWKNAWKVCANVTALQKHLKIFLKFLKTFLKFNKKYIYIFKISGIQALNAVKWQLIWYIQYFTLCYCNIFFPSTKLDFFGEFSFILKLSVLCSAYFAVSCF